MDHLAKIGYGKAEVEYVCYITLKISSLFPHLPGRPF